ncbi:sulfite exporter TauE/SafE family protein [Sphingomonas sp. FW199]|uniref:sulfite exporter TauE/SafE family protein n=1 Tax=Sphingomonas sp. FW199 TaxID=3400217 RepID=UPI003CEB3908
MEIFGFDLAGVLPFIAIGFAAQIIDGALGMAFGVISSTLMVSVMGVAPARASAGVHLVEMFTTAASGISHFFHRNIDWKLFARLVIPGVIGGVAGAYLLSEMGEGARPFVMAYLSVIGIYLIFRAFGIPPKSKEPKLIAPLGLIGGFLDAAGGGGWGPVVTSNLLIQGSNPRMTIGTVNSAEFFLTTAVSITFIAHLGFEAFTQATIGLLIGGVVAAPFGALLVKRIQPRLLLGLVGTVLTLTSAYSIYRAVT